MPENQLTATKKRSFVGVTPPARWPGNVTPLHAPSKAALRWLLCICGFSSCASFLKMVNFTKSDHFGLCAPFPSVLCSRYEIVTGFIFVFFLVCRYICYMLVKKEDHESYFCCLLPYYKFDKKWKYYVHDFSMVCSGLLSAHLTISFCMNYMAELTVLKLPYMVTVNRAAAIPYSGAILKVIVDIAIALRIYVIVSSIGTSVKFHELIPSRLLRLTSMWTLYYTACYVLATVHYMIAGVMAWWNLSETESIGEAYKGYHGGMIFYVAFMYLLLMQSSKSIWAWVTVVVTEVIFLILMWFMFTIYLYPEYVPRDHFFTFFIPTKTACIYAIVYTILFDIIVGIFAIRYYYRNHEDSYSSQVEAILSYDTLLATILGQGMLCVLIGVFLLALPYFIGKIYDENCCENLHVPLWFCPRLPYFIVLIVEFYIIFFATLLHFIVKCMLPPKDSSLWSSESMSSIASDAFDDFEYDERTNLKEIRLA
ncbi:hypothetical protein L596_017518 [Steinernema carpocapsae]|uniref:Uncharacterized protein n=1 Tax=Steinernema carpocapsae TaxID=34508 RepID=A0A4U5N2N6_STECR|nr:hypothetical protein L596_017518 [Steinernema carpocapsae]